MISLSKSTNDLSFGLAERDDIWGFHRRPTHRSSSPLSISYFTMTRFKICTPKPVRSRPRKRPQRLVSRSARPNQSAVGLRKKFKKILRRTCHSCPYEYCQLSRLLKNVRPGNFYYCCLQNSWPDLPFSENEHF